jgi:nucleotide-binding universal stress UspA family protein
MWPYGDIPPFDVDAACADAAADLERAAADVASRHPGLHVDTEVLVGPPADVLSLESKTADVAVVGTTGRKRLEDVLHGSTAHGLARSSSCPLALIPPSPGRVRTGRIVAGTDGSEHSDAALDWAVAETERRDAELLVVHAWFYPCTEFSSEDLHDRTRVEASLVLGAAVDRCSERTAVPVHGELVEDSAAPALIAAGSEADMIVLGSRGRGRFRTLQFGSVARTVAEHAPCPIVVIRPPK